MTIDAIVAAVRQYPAKLVEVTGGEPLYQDETPALLQALLDGGFQVMLETNGSLYLGDVPEAVIKIVDVKTPGSGMGTGFMKWNLKLLKPHDELKFVLTSHVDYRFAVQYIAEHSLQDRVIHFSPVLSVLPAETLAQWMLRDGVSARLQLQLHRLLNIQ